MVVHNCNPKNQMEAGGSEEVQGDPCCIRGLKGSLDKQYIVSKRIKTKEPKTTMDEQIWLIPFYMHDYRYEETLKLTRINTTVLLI